MSGVSLRSFSVELLHAIKGHGVDDISVIVENFINRPVTVRSQAEQDNHICIAAPFGMRFRVSLTGFVGPYRAYFFELTFRRVDSVLTLDDKGVKRCDVPVQYDFFVRRKSE